MARGRLRNDGFDDTEPLAVVGDGDFDVSRQQHPHPRRLEDIDADAWDRMQAINSRGAFLAIRAALAHLRASRGNVVLLGSIDGVKPVPAPVHYAASKGALAAMTRALAKELGEDGVKVNCVAPGILEGGLSATLPQALPTSRTTPSTST